jgi:hypothetical protein
MATYLIFNVTTGEVVHTHSEPDDVQTSHEGILAMVDAGLDRDELRVTVADAAQFRIGEAHRVEPASGQIQRREDEGPFGLGGGGPSSQLLPRGIRTVYQQAEPRASGTQGDEPDSS